jgi:hypothetical protein
MSTEQQIACFAADHLEEDGQFLPVWLFGGRIGGGDFPRSTGSKSAAKRVVTKQCNRQNATWVGYVVERRAGKLIVFEATRYDSTVGQHVGIAGCWRRGYYFSANGGQLDINVKTDVPRLRPSALAERLVCV